MASTTILSDNGASSGSAGYKITAGNDGVLILQTTTSGGTATNAVYVDNNQNVGMGGTTPSASTSNYRTLQVGLSANKYSIFGQRVAGSSETFVGWNVYGGSNTTTLGSGFVYQNTGDVAGLYTQNGQHTWFSAPSGTAGASVSFSQVLSVNKDTTLTLQGGTSSSGAGIAFPATQSASSDANTLDDYEEGTWTPTLNSNLGGSISLTILSATYTKIGRLVTVQFDIQTTSSFTGTGGSMRIGGLPFSLPSNTMRPTGNIQYQDVFQTPNGIIVPGLSSADNQCWLTKSTSQSATTTFATNVTSSDYLGTGRYLQGSITYETS